MTDRDSVVTGAAVGVGAVASFILASYLTWEWTASLSGFVRLVVFLCGWGIVWGISFTIISTAAVGVGMLVSLLLPKSTDETPKPPGQDAGDSSAE